MYTVGDFLIQIKNAYLAHKKEAVIKASRLSFAIAKVLEQERYIKKVEERQESGKKMLIIELLYKKKHPAITDITIISRPSVHRYVTAYDIKKSLRNFGIEIISTNRGVMTNKKAFEAGVGGELICRVS